MRELSESEGFPPNVVFSCGQMYALPEPTLQPGPPEDRNDKGEL